ncbi:MAG TPA: G1 family glutamic endopeptidase [Streptosporangiaceae bacterium]
MIHVGGQTQVGSFNWAGYADDNTASNTYSKITGKWKEPSIVCNTNEDQLAVFWVGIDGFSSSTVEQDGTLAQCFEGSVFYDTWWEMFPSNSIQVVGTTVAPGDQIAASVIKTSTNYKLTVTDSTIPANSFTTTQSCAAATCVDTSAEWIAEAPSGPRGEFPLPNFGTWSLTAATVKSGATIGKISSFPDDEITMIDGSQSYALATPGNLNATGNAFKVTWNDSF